MHTRGGQDDDDGWPNRTATKSTIGNSCVWILKRDACLDIVHRMLTKGAVVLLNLALAQNVNCNPNSIAGNRGQERKINCNCKRKEHTHKAVAIRVANTL